MADDVDYWDASAIAATIVEDEPEETLLVDQFGEPLRRERIKFGFCP